MSAEHQVVDEDTIARAWLAEPVTFRGAAKSVLMSAVAIALAFSVLLWLGATFMHHAAVAVP